MYAGKRRPDPQRVAFLRALPLEGKESITGEEAGRYIHHFVTGFDVDLTSLLDFNFSFVWDRIQEPRQNSDGTFPEQDDYRFILGLGFDF